MLSRREYTRLREWECPLSRLDSETTARFPLDHQGNRFIFSDCTLFRIQPVQLPWYPLSILLLSSLGRSSGSRSDQVGKGYSDISSDSHA